MIPMKKLSILLFIAVAISCSKDDDQHINSGLSGEWFLVNASCYCAFDDSINLNDFKLRFNDSEKILHLENPTESYYFINESGSYNYSLNGDIITIEGTNASYKFEIQGSHLILTFINDPAIADDELVLTFQRE